MPQSLQIKAANVDPALLDLPWEIPLEEWPEDILAALPRGISRHVVRFVNLSGRVIAVKEIGETVAGREYELLWDLARLGAPSVMPTAVVTGRRDLAGEELNGVLITEHLQFSLPYRALFRQSLSPETATKLIDALAVLLVRLHLLGFYWGDVSLSNTLFRRDAGSFSAYLVDAETGELHPQLTDGQRDYDVDLARVNIIGELMDLQSGGYLDEVDDVISIGTRIVERYEALWSELTAPELIESDQRWKVERRIERLNALGFSLGELTMSSDPGSQRLTIQPKVVDAGHYHRRIMRLTGLDVGEEQARRLLDDLDTYRAVHQLSNVPEEIVAHQWLREAFEPVIAAIPTNLTGKLEPAQVYHEYLEHRWFMAEQRQQDVPQEEAIASYIENVLSKKEDELLFLDSELLGLADPDDVGE
ncbi:DUF4032 domain-containing protein [Scrofimicrobium sp. R131]|uniref:DUF4032 domain-containing protein n=1 Tax=Scrofimicrobium appendicitidis TaxID=3079930 RepID=A0AAU7V8E8_9ACTO